MIHLQHRNGVVLLLAYNLPINNSYTVTYLSDDEFYKNETYNFNETITAAEAPEKEGFELTEWEGLPKTMRVSTSL